MSNEYIAGRSVEELLSFPNTKNRLVVLKGIVRGADTVDDRISIKAFLDDGKKSLLYLVGTPIRALPQDIVPYLRALEAKGEEITVKGSYSGFDEEDQRNAFMGGCLQIHSIQIRNSMDKAIERGNIDPSFKEKYCTIQFKY